MCEVWRVEGRGEEMVKVGTILFDSVEEKSGILQTIVNGYCIVTKIENDQVRYVGVNGLKNWFSVLFAEGPYVDVLNYDLHHLLWNIND